MKGTESSSVGSFSDNSGLAPAGLFGATESSARWQPSTYIPSLEIKSSKDVYGPLIVSGEGFLQLRPGPLPLLARDKMVQHGLLPFTAEEIDFSGPGSQSPKRIVTCQERFKSLTRSQAIAWLARAIKGREYLTGIGHDREPEHKIERGGRWYGESLTRMEDYKFENQFSASEKDLCEMIASLLEYEAPEEVTDSTNKAFDAAEDSQTWLENLPIIKSVFSTSNTLTDTSDRYDLISRILCIALGLPPLLASSHHLQVYTEQRQDGLFRIGLFSANFNPSSKPVTVQMTDNVHTVYYEVVANDSETQKPGHPPQYCVVGLWVPYTAIPRKSSSRNGTVLLFSQAEGNPSIPNAPYLVYSRGKDGYIV